MEIPSARVWHLNQIMKAVETILHIFYIIYIIFKENYHFQYFWASFFLSKNTLNFQYKYKYK